MPIGQRREADSCEEENHEVGSTQLVAQVATTAEHEGVHEHSAGDKPADVRLPGDHAAHEGEDKVDDQHKRDVREDGARLRVAVAIEVGVNGKCTEEAEDSTRRPHYERINRRREQHQRRARERRE